MDKHTPGPWHISDNGEEFGIYPPDGISPIGFVDYGNSGDANAKLIAAAPDMLATLKSVRSAIVEKAPDTLWADLIGTAVDVIDAAIAKAEGGDPKKIGADDNG